MLSSVTFSPITTAQTLSFNSLANNLACPVISNASFPITPSKDYAIIYISLYSENPIMPPI